VALIRGSRAINSRRSPYFPELGIPAPPASGPMWTVPIRFNNAGTQCSQYRSRSSARRQSSPVTTARHSDDPQPQARTKSASAVLVA